MKLEKLINYIYPFLALLSVLVLLEISFNVFDNFGLVVPYRDYFYHKSMKKSVLKGDPWTKKEFENTVYRDRNFQHVPQVNLNDESQKYIFLLGDSMVESVSSPVDQTFYSIVDQANESITIFPFHFAGCSLKALVLYLQKYYLFLRRSGQAFKPDMAILQIRPLSYQGGNTNVYDEKARRPYDFQDKIEIEKPSVVLEKEKFLSSFKLDIKFSKKWQDQFFRKLVLGDSKVISFIAWKIFQWSRRVTASAPNHEKFFVDNQMEELYWLRFEKTLKLLQETIVKMQIPIKVMLVPDRELVRRYFYTNELNSNQKRYQELFAKYGIPFYYAIEDFAQLKKMSPGEDLFYADNHPNEAGKKALIKAFEKTIVMGAK